MDTAQNLLLQLRQRYLSDIPERANELEELVLEMENSGITAERYNDLFRRIHSLKGSGGTYGAHIITAVCHCFEDYLSFTNFQENRPSPQSTKIALSFVDLLRLAADTLRNNPDNIAEIEARLADLRRRVFLPQYVALVVESTGTIVSIIRRVLKNYGCRMVLMEDGYQALGRALVEPFDLVITSMETPGLNGSALITALKLAVSANNTVKCILLTANQNLTLPNPEPDYLLLKNGKMMANLNAMVKSVIGESVIPKDCNLIDS
jgi:CheY-like chemotaxis protein/HPt (histidine-containing phosphotransfer) domain-containing protein